MESNALDLYEATQAGGFEPALPAVASDRRPGPSPLLDMSELQHRLLELRRPIKAEFVRESFDAYKKTWAINKSALFKMLVSPLHCLAYLFLPGAETRVDRKMRIGTAAHCAVLEPERWSRVLVEPYNRGTKKLEAWLAELPPGTETEEASVYRAASDMAEVAWSRRSVRQALMPFDQPGLAEISAYANTSSGMAAKARLDYLVDGYVIDYKTTGSANDYRVQKVVADKGYHWQVALYLAIVQKITGVPHYWKWVWQEQEPPYDVRVTFPDPAMIEVGRRMVAGYLGELERCIDSQRWPGYPDKLEVTTLPRWEALGDEFEGVEI